MIIKGFLFREYLEKSDKCAVDFARETYLTVGEVEQLLGGEPVNEAVARVFIYHVGPDTAQSMIDWDALGKVNPLDNE